MGSKQDTGANAMMEQARASEDKAAAQYNDVNTPDILSQQLQLQGPQLAGTLSMQDLGPSDMAKIATDPAYKNAMMSSLQGMQDRANSGLTDADKAMLNQAQQQSEQANTAQQSSIMQNLAERGQAGSGQELASRLNASQNASMARANQANNIAIASQQAKQNALAQLGSMGTQMQAQQFGQEAQQAQAADTIAKMNWQQSNQNQAANLAAAQANANANTSIQNQQQQYNKQLEQQGFANQMALQGAKAGAYQQGASLEQNQAGLLAQQKPGQSLLGAAMPIIGTIGGAAVGGMVGGPGGAMAAAGQGAAIGGAVGNAGGAMMSKQSQYADGGAIPTSAVNTPSSLQGHFKERYAGQRPKKLTDFLKSSHPGSYEDGGMFQEGGTETEDASLLDRLKQKILEESYKNGSDVRQPAVATGVRGLSQTSPQMFEDGGTDERAKGVSKKARGAFAAAFPDEQIPQDASNGPKDESQRYVDGGAVQQAANNIAFNPSTTASRIQATLQSGIVTDPEKVSGLQKLLQTLSTKGTQAGTIMKDAAAGVGKKAMMGIDEAFNLAANTNPEVQRLVQAGGDVPGAANGNVLYRQNASGQVHMPHVSSPLASLHHQIRMSKDLRAQNPHIDMDTDKPILANPKPLHFEDAGTVPEITQLQMPDSSQQSGPDTSFSDQNKLGSNLTGTGTPLQQLAMPTSNDVQTLRESKGVNPGMNSEAMKALVGQIAGNLQPKQQHAAPLNIQQMPMQQIGAPNMMYNLREKLALNPNLEDGGHLQNFEKGGMSESGDNSYVGDRVDAKINDGEMVINLDQQQRLMDLLRGHLRPSEIPMDQDIIRPANSNETNLHKKNMELQSKLSALDKMRQ